MSLSIKGISTNKDTKSTLSNKVTSLNPNAAEFVPSSLRYSFGNAKQEDSTRLDITGTSRTAVLDRSESSISNNSDEEAHQFWRHQLPDDITPDFKAMGENESRETGHLSLSGLSIHDGGEIPRFSALTGSQIFDTHHDSSDALGLVEDVRYSGSTFAGDHSVGTFGTSATNAWDELFVSRDQYLIDPRDDSQYSGDPHGSFLTDMVDQATFQDATINAVEILASQYPGFSAESLAEVYYANDYDLDLTIETLTQLELQVDESHSQNLNSKASMCPNLNQQEFPALLLAKAQNGISKINVDDIGRTPNPYTSSNVVGGATDYALTVRKLSSQDSGPWKYGRNGSADGRIGSSRTPQLITNSQNGHEKMVYGDKVQSSRAAWVAPVWLETEEAVANMYSESREEACDFARLQNACFDQAREAYLIGNKALAKELSVKGQLYSIQMKTAHVKAREAIYRQRSPVSSENQSYGRGQEHLIDLHGLHVNEALHVLKRELSALRTVTRSTGQHLQVMICVGTGHHTRGSRMPARLPVAVEHYLLEENLHYSQPQPGLLHVVMF
ncbi:putative polyadenylate-binding protein-interacting protein/7, CUE [Dioscorea sansibarensis]